MPLCPDGGIPDTCYDPCEVSLQGNVTGMILSKVLIADPTDVTPVTGDWAVAVAAGNVRFFLYSNGSKGGTATEGKGYGEILSETTGYEHTLTLEYKFSESQFSSFEALTTNPQGWYLYFTSPKKIWSTGAKPAFTSMVVIPEDLKGRVTYAVTVKWTTGNSFGMTPYTLDLDSLAALCVGN